MKRIVLAVPLLLISAVAGCSTIDASPVDSGIPNASTSPSPDRSLPPPGVRWKGLPAQCPDLTSAAAHRLGTDGHGAPTDEYATNPLVTSADCRWGSTDGHGVAVQARISIWTRQESADAQWQVLSKGKTADLPVGDAGFLTEEAEAIVVRARSGNVVTVVRLTAPVDRPDTTALRQDAAEITLDVLDDLVRA